MAEPGMGLVDITLPTGEAATVLERDLQQELAAGSHVTTEKEQLQREIGGAYGQAMTGIIGAGRTATFGLSDQILGEGANIAEVFGVGPGRKDMLKALALAKEANPYSNMGGEALGLVMPAGAGSTISEIGAGAEAAAASRLGSGLVGRVGSMALRGGVEGALIAEQQQISEDYLGDHNTTGEKLFAAMGKGALLGGGIGAGFGVGSHALSTALSGIRGPLPLSALDDAAGMPGAGKQVLAEADGAQAIVSKLERAGATSEQAAKMADDVFTMGRTKANAGPLSGLIDEAQAAYVARRAGGNAEMADILNAGYADRASKLAKRAEVLDQHALDLKKIGDRVMRAEDALNEVQFTYKGEQMARLVEPSTFSAQRDLLAANLQKTDDVLRFWESTAAKGGAEGAIKTLRKQHTDALYALAKVEESGSAQASRDFFIRADKFKQSIDKLSQYGKSPYGMPEAFTHPEMGLRQLGDSWRSALEDEAVWGQAGLAQKEWNATFSNGFARRQDFGGRFSARIDEVRGIPVAEMDAEKVKAGLLKKLGSEADSQQAMKSTEAWIDGNRQRISAIERYGELTPKQQAALNDGKAALDQFSKRLGSAKGEAEIIAKLETMQLEEQGKALGGVLGLGADLLTRPATTMQRLAAIRRATVKLEETIAGGLKRFFDGKGAEVIEKYVRPKADVAAEISEIKTLAASPPALEQRAMASLGDLTRHAPKVASATADAARRAVTFLAAEAPRGTAPITLMALSGTKPRYSDQELAAWETKRDAAFHPQSVVEDMRRGRMNRDAIRTVKLVYPQMFAQMQQIARDQILRLQAEGKLDKMPYEQKAVISTLLEVPADGTWQPDFIAMMQAVKAMPVQQTQPAGAQPVVSARAIKLNTDMFATEADQIEGRKVA